MVSADKLSIQSIQSAIVRIIIQRHDPRCVSSLLQGKIFDNNLTIYPHHNLYHLSCSLSTIFKDPIFCELAFRTKTLKFATLLVL